MTFPGSMTSSDLVIVDFDGALYASPEPPRHGDLTWYYHAHSLSGWDRPGFDHRWNHKLIAELRQAANRDAKLMALSTRPDHQALRTVVRDMLWSTGLPWTTIQLRPVFPLLHAHQYRTSTVAAWLTEHTGIRRVVMYGSDPEAMTVVQAVVLARGVQFVPRLVSPPRLPAS
jgi:hypothetical protein